MRIFEQLESEVRSYIRSFPVVFDVAEGSFLYDEQGQRYIDFFSGAGTLNYGHNNPLINNAIIDYLKRRHRAWPGQGHHRQEKFPAEISGHHSVAPQFVLQAAIYRSDGDQCR